MLVWGSFGSLKPVKIHWQERNDLKFHEAIELVGRSVITISGVISKRELIRILEDQEIQP